MTTRHLPTRQFALAWPGPIRAGSVRRNGAASGPFDRYRRRSISRRCHDCPLRMCQLALIDGPSFTIEYVIGCNDREHAAAEDPP